MRSLSLVLCVALCVGVAVSIPVDAAEGEESPVATLVEASPAEDTPAEPQAVEDLSEPRPKRWYSYYYGWPQLPFTPYYGGAYGHRSSGFPVDMDGAGSFAAPAVAGPTGRTRVRPGDDNNFRASASLNELFDHNRRQEHLWQHQQWQRDQFVRQQQHFPDVIDTAAFSNIPNFQNNFPNNFQNNFQNNFPSNFQNAPAVIDTQSPQSRTRGGPGNIVAPSGPVPAYAFDPNYPMHPNMNGFPHSYPFPVYR